MKKCIKVIILLLFFLILLNTKSIASTKLDGIENFPENYKPYLYELKNKHPNWQFTALYTDLDWNTCIYQEYRNDKNLVPIGYSDSWKCLDNGIYNVEIDKGWVNSSWQAIEYTMDPRNFLNSTRIFQFEKLTYDPNINNLDGIEKILYGTEFYNRIVTYLDSNGAEIVTNKKYSELILDAAIYSGVSPYHLASRIKQEVGPFLSHSSISGKVSGFEGLYNFYNIGATSSTEPLGAIKNGLQYAKNGKGSLTVQELQNQLIPWDTKERAIKGGAVFIGKSYILAGQNTIYLQKFNVYDNSANSLFWHQYMTNCLAPFSESKSMYTAYQNSGLLDGSIGFLIPIFNNMPEYPADSPNIVSSDYIDDNTVVFADVTGNLNVRSGPSTTSEIITTVNRQRNFIRIKKGIQSGERWDKVVLDNGIVGYVFQSYLKEVPKENDAESGTGEETGENNKESENGENPIDNTGSEGNNIPGNNVETGNGEEQGQNNMPENNDNSGEITEPGENNIQGNNGESGSGNEQGQNELTGNEEENEVPGENNEVPGENNKEEDGEQPVMQDINQYNIKFPEYWRISENTISNIDLAHIKVSEILELIDTNLKLEIRNKNNQILENDKSIGTGSKLIVKDENGNVIIQYIFIIYGDLNGDGQINSLDVLILQKHILEIKELKNEFLKAANISKNGQLPSALDVLKIQKHILEIKLIDQ